VDLSYPYCDTAKFIRIRPRYFHLSTAKYLGNGSRMIIKRTARGAQILTSIIFLVIYQIALTSHVVIGFGIASLKIHKSSAAGSG